MIYQQLLAYSMFAFFGLIGVLLTLAALVNRSNNNQSFIIHHSS